MNTTGIVAGVAGASGSLDTLVWLWNWLAVSHGAPEMPQGVAGFFATIIGAACAVLGHYLQEAFHVTQSGG